MKKTFIVVSLIITATFTFAQKDLSKDYDYKVSKPYKVVDARSKEYFSNGTEVLGVKIKANKNQVLLQKYNVEGMKEIGKEVYNDLPKNFIYEGLVEAQDKFYFFYSSWTGKKTKHERLFYREIDFGTGTFKGDSKQIIDHDGYLVGSFGRRGAKFDLLTSEDQSIILIQYRKKPKVKKDTKSWDIINVDVFDSNLNSLWKSTYTMPYTERRMNFLDNLIDNDANVFMLTKVFHDDSNNDKKNRLSKEANYHIELFELNKTLDEIKTSKISLEDKFIKGIKMYQSLNKDIFCAGFYNKGKGSVTADGLFTYKMNQKGVLSSKNYYEIPLEILNQYVKRKTKHKNNRKNKKGKAEYKDLELKDVIFFDDNSIGLIGEVNYIRTYQHVGMNGTTGAISILYHYDDILFTKINSNGDLAWMKKIPKRQSGGNGQGGMSYTYFYANGNHYIIYLDNVENIDLPLDKFPARHTDGKGGFLTSLKINDVTGKAVKGSVLDFRKIKGGIVAYQFNTDRIVKIKDNEFFVEVYKKKKEDIFLKVEIKN